MSKLKLVVLYTGVYFLVAGGLLGVFYWKTKEVRWDLLLILTLTMIIADLILRKREKAELPDSDERVIHLMKVYTRRILIISFVLLSLGTVVYQNIVQQTTIPIMYLTIYVLITSSAVMITQLIVKHR
jgi:hypothetical protein